MQDIKIIGYCCYLTLYDDRIVLNGALIAHHSHKGSQQTGETLARLLKLGIDLHWPWMVTVRHWHTCQPSWFSRETPVFHCPLPVPSRGHTSPVVLPIFTPFSLFVISTCFWRCTVCIIPTVSTRTKIQLHQRSFPGGKKSRRIKILLQWS